MKRDEDVMAQVCGCGRKWGDHSFAEFVNCQYEGTPLKRGGVFTIETAREIANRVANKLAA